MSYQTREVKYEPFPTDIRFKCADKLFASPFTILFCTESALSSRICNDSFHNITPHLTAGVVLELSSLSNVLIKYTCPVLSTISPNLTVVPKY